MEFNLINITGDKLTTTSLIISELFGRPHKNVLERLDSLINDGTLTGLEIRPSEYRDKSGKSNKLYVLEEKTALVAMPFIGGKLSRKGQRLLVDEFFRIRKELQQEKEMRFHVDWQEARENSKCIRKTLGSAISVLEKLADSQGGLKTDKDGNFKAESRKYYSTITKMIYKQLFGDSSLKKVRDKLDALQLTFLSICEESCADEIDRLADAKVDYHDIYAEAKKRVIATVDGLSASRLKSSNAIKLVWENKQIQEIEQENQ